VSGRRGGIGKNLGQQRVDRVIAPSGKSVGKTQRFAKLRPLNRRPGAEVIDLCLPEPVQGLANAVTALTRQPKLVVENALQRHIFSGSNLAHAAPKQLAAQTGSPIDIL